MQPATGAGDWGDQQVCIVMKNRGPGLTYFCPLFRDIPLSSLARTAPDTDHFVHLRSLATRPLVLPAPNRNRKQMARNTDVSPYIGKLSRSQVYSKKGQYKRERKGVPSAEPTAAEKRASYYPADDSVSRPKISRKVNKPTKLRATITPGTVVILLAGRFRGQSTLHHSVASFVPPSRRETVCERERGRGGGGESGEN